MPTETLHYENARVAQQLFNHEPRNLKAVETELGVKATAREGWIKLDGPADAIERALAHTGANETRAIYNRSQYWAERVEMAQWWSDYLDALKASARRTAA